MVLSLESVFPSDQSMQNSRKGGRENNEKIIGVFRFRIAIKFGQRCLCLQELKGILPHGHCERFSEILFEVLPLMSQRTSTKIFGVCNGSSVNTMSVNFVKQRRM